MRNETRSDHTHPSFAELLEMAITHPGIISDALRQFHNYSFGNHLLAWSQIAARQLELGPIAPYNRWKELGRHVKRGEKALVLCMPITIKKTVEGDAGAEETIALQRFVYK